MKTMTLLLAATLASTIAGCAATSPAPSESTTENQMICDPCDPAGSQSLINAWVGAGSPYGSQRGPVWCRSQNGYDDDNNRITYTVCSGTWGDDGGHNTDVWCSNRNGYDDCATWGCGEGSEPPCGGS